jgi:hypothetical protein
MRYAPRALLAGGLTLAACSLAACGGGAGLLSSDQATNFNAALDSVSTAVQNGNCAAANNAADSLRNEVANLPPSVNPSLKANLNEGVQKATIYAQTACRSSTTSKTTTSSTTTTDTTTSKPTTTSSSSSTTSSPSTITSTTTATSTATTTSGSGTSSNGSGGAGLGGGNGGNGNGNGGGGGENGQ